MIELYIHFCSKRKRERNVKTREMMIMMMLCMLLSIITVVAHANARLDQVNQVITGMEG